MTNNGFPDRHNNADLDRINRAYTHRKPAPIITCGPLRQGSMAWAEREQQRERERVEQWNRDRSRREAQLLASDRAERPQWADKADHAKGARANDGSTWHERTLTLTVTGKTGTPVTTGTLTAWSNDDKPEYVLSERDAWHYLNPEKPEAEVRYNGTGLPLTPTSHSPIPNMKTVSLDQVMDQKTRDAGGTDYAIRETE
jgi:hypothetical protein